MSFAAVFDHERPQNFLYTLPTAEASGGRGMDGRPMTAAMAVAAPHQSCRITKISIASSFISPLWLPQNVVALEKAKHATHGKSKRPSRWSKPFRLPIHI